jgi:hypothetical protein
MESHLVRDSNSSVRAASQRALEPRIAGMWLLWRF